jgi:L-2-hydroxyglutarate oxidase LhgO
MQFVIVGAGIVGLAAARTVLASEPSAEVIVIDKELDVAQHQTGHNSGVVHAGLYYTPGSLKARLCRRGIALMRDYCNARDIAYEECGKVLVATDERELARLAGIDERAEANGVPGVRRLDQSGLRAIEPHAAGLGGLYSPTTAIVDFASVARALRDEVVERGGRVTLGARVAAIREEARTVGLNLVGGESLEADRVLVAAGLQVDRLARASGRSADPRIVPFRGDYYALRPGYESLVRGLIYPVPDPSLPFLGIHLTRHPGGGVWIGPNAVLSLAREGYSRKAFNWADVADTLRWSGTRRLARRHWRAGAAEIARSTSQRLFVKSAQRYLPELSVDSVTPAPSGIRAQAVTAAGDLADDFVLDRTPRVVWVRNAPSPAATSALAIAEELVERLVR